MSTQADSFYELFNGYERAKGRYTITGVESSGKVGGKASTIIEAPSVRDWELHLAGKQGVGIIPIREDNCCYFGALDIDDRTVNHIDLEDACKNLPVVVCRSKSGGAHVYVFFTEPVPAIIVQEKLNEWAAALGVGGCEVFPKQIKRASDKDIGNWINMPYFGGDDTDRMAYKGGVKIGMAEFIAYAHSRRITPQQLASIVLNIKEDLFSDGPPCLQHLVTKGFPEGTRNQGLYAVAVYYKKRNPDTCEADVMSFNTKYMQPPLSLSEVQTIVKSVNRKDYAYKCKEQPLCNHCNKKACLGRKFGIGNGGGHDGGARVQIGNITKIDTEPPIWIIDIEGERVEVDTDTLQQQRKFQTVCMERIHKCPPTINATRWSGILNELLKNVEIIPAPEDAGVRGQFYEILDQFLTERPISTVREELIVGRCYHDHDSKQVWFRSRDLIVYLESKRFKATESKIWSYLRKKGAGNDRVRAGAKLVSIWTLPESLLPKSGNVLPIPAAITGVNDGH